MQFIDSNQLSFGEEKLDGLINITITSLHEITTNYNKVNLVVVVLQNTTIRSVTIKHGSNTGNYVDLASILVGDQSEFYVTISFWEDHAKWVHKLNIGDIVVLTNMAFTVNKNHKVGKATEASVLYNFKNPGSSISSFKGKNPKIIIFKKNSLLEMKVFEREREVILIQF